MTLRAWEAPVYDFNLLVSASWRAHGAAKREIHELLGALGDERPLVGRTIARGILGVKTGLEPRLVVRQLRALLEREPQRFEFTCKWVPVVIIAWRSSRPSRD